MKFPLTLESLKTLDLGKIDLAFRRELRACVEDIRDRPNEQAKREVHLVLELVPDKPDRTGEVETARVTFKIWAKAPKRQSRTYSVGVQKDGNLLVNDMSPDDISQGTLDQV